jgi:hypothetical protein
MLNTKMRGRKHGVGYSSTEIGLLLVAFLCVLGTSWYVYANGPSKVNGHTKIMASDLSVLESQSQALYAGLRSKGAKAQIISLMGTQPNPTLLAGSDEEILARLQCNKPVPSEYVVTVPNLKSDVEATVDVLGLSDGQETMSAQLVWYHVSGVWQMQKILCSS